MHTSTTDLPALVTLYLGACHAEGKSTKSLAAYRESLSFYIHLAPHHGLPLDVLGLSTADVYRFLAAVRARRRQCHPAPASPRSQSTICRPCPPHGGREAWPKSPSS